MKDIVFYALPGIAFIIWFLYKYFKVKEKMSRVILALKGFGVYFFATGLAMFIDVKFISGTARLAQKGPSIVLHGQKAIDNATQSMQIGIISFVIYWILAKYLDEDL